MKSKVIITGGHHNSALVIAQALRQKKYAITWVGHRHSMIGDPHDSLEYQEVSQAGFPFINLLAGKFHPKAHPLHLLRIPLGLIQALILLLKIKPQLVLCFGGYIAVPVALAAKLTRVPVIAFEQTTAIGRANQLISRFSEINFLAWASSLSYFPPHNSRVIGLPLPKPIFKAKAKAQLKSKPKLLITGGKQGSHVINQAVFKAVPQLVKKFVLIHLTGKSRKTRDFEAGLTLRQKLPAKFHSRYRVKAHLKTSEMITALRSSNLVISRSGAHITYELLALAKPAILIPLPFSYLNEQQKNAAKLAEHGTALIIPQDQLSAPRLIQTVEQIIKNYKRFYQRAQKASQLIKTNAAAKAVNYICQHFANETEKDT